MNLVKEKSVNNELEKQSKPRVRLTFLYIAVLAAVLVLIIELFNHKAFTNGPASFLNFVKSNPSALIVNFAIVLLTLCPALLIRRRVFWCTLVSAIWLIGGAVNGFILLNRMTPFTMSDLTIFETGLETLPNYLSKKYIILLAVAIVVLIVGLIVLFIKGPKSSVDIKKRIIFGILALALSGGLLAGGWSLSFKLGHLSETFPNLAFAYEDYGFPYCFLQTWLNKGIHTPNNYTPSAVEKLRQPEIESEPQNDVNVVYVQLESFIDPLDVKGLELSEEAIPTWRELTKKYSTGYLTVPVVGAGTANTECEVLTGMSTKMFGPGEYPYKTCLIDRTAETVAYNLKENGYGTHAIHNHRAAFYQRNYVYKNLGFDDFTALEYMPKVEKTPKNWAKDFVLTSQIIQAMDVTPDQPDVVFTVSVQGHGKYPNEPILDDPKITVKSCPDEDYRYGIEYYVNQINEMDQFVSELITALEQRDEKTVLVLYGDHLPALNFKAEDMGSNTLYNTTYVIWDNFGLEKEDKDLTAYQISSEVMKRLGITTGNMNRYHQLCSGNDDYLEGLHMLQYDVLYGKKYLYNGESPYEPTDMRMGAVPIRVDDVFESLGKWYVTGENFTPYCKVVVDGHQMKTSYVSTRALRLKEAPSTEDLSKYSIRIVEKHKEVLSETPAQP